MDQREYLVKAQEAEAFANAATNPIRRRAWESIAKEYRRLVRLLAKLDGDQEQQPNGDF